MSDEPTDQFKAPEAGAALAPAEDNSWKNMLKWKHTTKGEVLEPNSLVNAIMLLRYHELFRDVFVLNEFSDEIIIRRCPPWENEKSFRVHRLEHNDIVQCSASLEYEGLNPSMEKCVNAIAVVAQKNAVHPMREYFEKLSTEQIWDGVDRIDTWLFDYAGAKDNGQPPEYVSPVGKKWLVAAVKRIYEPGCKFDHMLVLEGGQNIGKSTILKTLATIGPEDGEKGEEIEYFTDAVKFSNINDLGSIMMLQGKLIVEFSELAGMNRKEIEDVKNWVTRQIDVVQKKYKNETTDYPRQFVLAGTTNEDTWLRDHTGNRRFLPIKTSGKLDIEGLKAVRQQLWAEAVHYYKAGYQIWIEYGSELEEMASGEQQARLVDDVWTDPVMDKISWLRNVTVNQVLELIPVEPARRDETASRRVGRILRNAGWRPKSKRVAGISTKVFENPANREKDPCPRTADMKLDETEKGAEDAKI